MPRPNDGMLTRFNHPVMDALVTLVPDFSSVVEAEVFYGKLRRRAKFKRMVAEHLEMSLPDSVRLSDMVYRCTSHVKGHYVNLTLGDKRHNPMEVLHIVAHYLQSSDSKWHGGEFGKIFLELVGMIFGPDMKRAAKDVLIANKIKTTAFSEATRERQRNAYYRRLDAEVPARMLAALRELQELGIVEQD